MFGIAFKAGALLKVSTGWGRLWVFSSFPVNAFVFLFYDLKDGASEDLGNLILFGATQS